MKYMGSKRAMLQNGLGDLLRGAAKGHRRVVDLFCGAASVSWFAAQELGKAVLATDLQEYAVVLARAVIERDTPLETESLTESWLEEAREKRKQSRVWCAGSRLDLARYNAATWSMRAKELCAERSNDGGHIWRAYGGHYYSPTQALTLDAMLSCLPSERIWRSVCLAATVIAASKCAASPGHTAQPFKANRTAGPFLREAWLRDPLQCAMGALSLICPRHAVCRGKAQVADANKVAEHLCSDDLVFVDPPYSGVHYSRFYHVLETVARGACGPVEGVGRYPPSDERPASRYSRKTESLGAARSLLQSLARSGCTVVLTFPREACSNGLSGEDVHEVARQSFVVERNAVKTRFSTLGGNCTIREARKVSDELMLLLRPR